MLITRFRQRRRAQQDGVLYTDSEQASVGIGKLWYLLEWWQPAQKLTLELNSISIPNMHGFEHLYFSSDQVEGPRSPVPPCGASPAVLQDMRSHPGCYESRLFKPLWLKFPEKLPQLPSVERLIIRRQLRQSIAGGGQEIGNILRSLTGLRELIYEPWEPLCEMHRKTSSQGEFRVRGTLILNKTLMCSSVRHDKAFLPKSVRN